MRAHIRRLRAARGAALFASAALAAMLSVACPSNDPSETQTSTISTTESTATSTISSTSDTASTTTATTTGFGGALNTTVTSATGSGVGGNAGSPPDDPACVEINQEARVIERPVDIIFIIDNSGSMSDEIDQVKARINEDFAQIIEQSGIDYRVIFFSSYGAASLQVCVKAPLGADDCSAPVAGSPADNPPKLYYYDYTVSSLDSLCLLLSRWDQPDLSGGPGWSEYLRPGAYKVFVEITDDGVGCGAFSDRTADPNDAVRSAREFDGELRKLSRDQFGVALQRTYSWFSIVGIQENVPPEEPWPPQVDGAAAKVQTGQCSTAASPGLTYQVLSIATGALRWPVCRNDDFSAMFNAIATNIVQKASVRCDWDLPDPPTGKTYDIDKLGISYLPSSGEARDLPPAGASSDCGAGWYVDDLNSPHYVALCPETCSEVRADDNARLNISVPCDSIIDVPK